ncbi:hypothetical protein KIW84_035992 [Lathyrus oleraceus]|uniref:Uncharacterized protein n=1 Tax=Pisum sativum TaxID=3888 RepID=A0A9D4Y3E9_PEA|nr:hypothetical protein KIW84_035992 [Pisum sativum]
MADDEIDAAGDDATASTTVLNLPLPSLAMVLLAVTTPATAAAFGPTITADPYAPVLPATASGRVSISPPKRLYLCRTLSYEGPVSGYHSVLRTFISAFIASYEINLQPEDELVETGVENDVHIALTIFSFQYVLVNHEYWKYKIKHVRWKITLKVLELMKKCIILMPYCGKLGEIVHNVLFSDASIHNALCHIACTTAHVLEKLNASRFFDPMEIEGLQLAIGSILDILSETTTKLAKISASPT